MRPKIVNQPNAQTVLEADPVSFSVTAEGVGTLSYRWRHNARLLTGQTNATLVISNVQPSDAGNYSVSVTHWFPWGSATAVSSNATLTVVPAK